MKHQKHNQFNMSQKSRVKKELIKTEQDDKKFIKYPYAFTSSNVYNKDTSFLNSEARTPLFNLQYVKLSQMSGIDVLSKSSSETSICNEKEENKHKQVHFNISNKLVISNEKNTVIPETPELSFKTNSLYYSQSLFDFIKSQNFIGITNIIQSIAKRSTYSTQPQISECSTALQSTTEETASGLDEETDYLKLSRDINQLFQHLEKLSSSNRNNKLDAIAFNKFALLKSDLVQNEVNVSLSKCKNQKFFVNQENASIEQLIKNTFVASNATTNYTIEKQISGLRTNTDAIQSGLNMSCLNKVESSVDNNYLSQEITPLINTNVNNTIKKNSFKTSIGVNNNYGNLKKRNTAFTEFLKYQHLHKKCLLNNVTPTISTDISTNSIPDLDRLSQNAYEQFMMNFVYNNSSINVRISNRVINSSLQVSEKKSSCLEILNLESHGNEFVDNCSVKYKSQIMSSIASQSIENKSKEFHSQSIILSLPLTQDNVECMLLPSSVFLSNYCCEYDKAYTKKDLKPTSYKNYYSNKIIDSLKEHFDKAITPKQSLEAFFKAPDVFEQLEIDLHETVDNILHMLENESDEKC